MDSLCENNGKRDDISGDPNTKKVSLKDPTSNINDVMAVDSTPVPTLSQKDMVLGKGSIVSKGESDSNAANEVFFFLEGDVKKLIVNGIPAIDFSDRIQKLLVKDKSTSVILKSTGRDKDPSQSRWANEWAKSGSSDAFGPNTPFDDHLKGRMIQPNSEQKDIVVVASTRIFDREVDKLGKSMLTVPAGFNNKNCLHFNHAFGELAAVTVTINEGLLNTNNHLAVTFHKTSNLILTGVKGANETTSSGNSSNLVNSRDSDGKVRDTKGGWKINKTLKGPSNHFKALGSSRVYLARSMLMVADLISLKLDSQAVKEKVTGEIEGSNSIVHGLQVNDFKADTIIEKLGFERTHQSQSIFVAFVYGNLDRGFFGRIYRYLSLQIQVKSMIWVSGDPHSLGIAVHSLSDWIEF
ncbi:hypothetical protein J1N35_018604 [Gossypium stocksii]|uniref:Uncharacterized protein n=1 Tax=Gossypium stocksii TaxID=47602 RepID=A0A9D3VQN4_9ROSI|nr:hypothetical protein J1N35_018604 [Gossypium stocksii]